MGANHPHRAHAGTMNDVDDDWDDLDELDDDLSAWEPGA